MEAKKYPRIGVGVLIFNKNNKVLLGKRINSHGTGHYAPVGGNLEFGETIEQCAVREAKEETGLDLSSVDFVTIAEDMFKAENKHYVSIIMKADFPQYQNIINMEPAKVENWEWYSIDRLPKPLFSPLRNISWQKLQYSFCN